MLRFALLVALVAVTVASPIFPSDMVPESFKVEWTRAETEGHCCDSCTGTKNMYFSIADDSGPWLCGQTCIRDSFYPIFHIFEKNLTKSSSNTVCHDAGYTHYNSTVTHGGGGLYCTLDLYSCPSGDCEHPSKAADAKKDTDEGAGEHGGKSSGMLSDDDLWWDSWDE